MTTDIDELERLLAAATPGEWAYRPDEYDDWGIVKSAPREVGNYDPPFIMRGVIGQFRDPDARDEDTLKEHRRNGTDPWYANASLIVAARNSLPAMIAEIRELRAENARLKEDVRRQTSLANDHFRNAKRLAARAALGEPQWP